MKTKTQFPPVHSRWGAPMGRREYHVKPSTPRSVRLFKVNLDAGGYDDGGAYWGVNQRWESLYCATDDATYMEFIRAGSRAAAAAALKLPAGLLKVGTVTRHPDN
jgi:hypothetical protein